MTQMTQIQQRESANNMTGLMHWLVDGNRCQFISTKTVFTLGNICVHLRHLRILLHRPGLMHEAQPELLG